MNVKSRVISNMGFTRGQILSVIETYCDTFQSLMQLRGGFAAVDPSVRRLRRPVACRLIAGRGAIALRLKICHNTHINPPGSA